MLFKQWMSERGLSHKVVAQELGVDESMINQIVEGAQNPSSYLLSRIMIYTGHELKEQDICLFERSKTVRICPCCRKRINPRLAKKIDDSMYEKIDEK